MSVVAVPEGLSVLIDGEVVLLQGRGQCLVESKSIADTWYSVEIDDDGNVTCTCKGFEVRKRCRHARAIQRLSVGEADIRFRDDTDA